MAQKDDFGDNVGSPLPSNGGGEQPSSLSFDVDQNDARYRHAYRALWAFNIGGVGLFLVIGGFAFLAGLAGAGWFPLGLGLFLLAVGGLLCSPIRDHFNWRLKRVRVSDTGFSMEFIDSRIPIVR